MNRKTGTSRRANWMGFLILSVSVPFVSARGQVFGSNETGHSSSIIDPASRSVVSTIPLGQRARGIHSTPDGKRIYVALSDNVPMIESAGDRIGVVDVASRRVIARFRAGSDPEQFAVTPDGTVLYTWNEDAGSASAPELRAGKGASSMLV